MKLHWQIIMVVVFNFNSVAKAQRSVDYNFVVKNKIIVDTISKMYAYSEFEFASKRVYFTDSIFSEQNIFRQAGKKITVVHFKQTQFNWYIKEKGCWKSFYATGQKISPTITLGSKKVKLVYEKISELYGLPCVIFKYTEVGIQTGGHSYYWFNPKFGIILIQADDFELIRKDILALRK